MIAPLWGLFFSILLSFHAAPTVGTSDAAQVLLPPEGDADRHLRSMEDLNCDRNHADTFETPNKFTAFHNEDNSASPDVQNYSAARLGQSADSVQDFPYTVTGDSADSSPIGKHGKFFKERRLRLNKVKADVEESCTGKALGESCWMSVANHPECSVWNTDLRKDETVIWTGSCSGDLPEGIGTIIWTFVRRDTLKTTEAGKGRLQNGKYHGLWVEHYWDGTVGEGTYVDGKRHGRWEYRHLGGAENDEAFVDGNKRGHGVYYETSGREWGGFFVDGNKQGQWRECYPRGVQKSSFVDGSRHGHWVWIDRNWFGTDEDGEAQTYLVYDYLDGTVGEGPYVDGKKHGHWIFTDIDSSLVEEGPYADGKKHGHWVRRQDNGYEIEGPNVDGKKHGNWVETYPTGRVKEGPYANGKKHGRWVERQSDGKGWAGYNKEHVQWLKREMKGTVWGGSYVNDKKHGYWIERDYQGGVAEGHYADGEKNGHWVRRIGRRDIWMLHIVSVEGTYLRGRKTGTWVTLYRDGSVEEGNYADGKANGRWVTRHANGDLEDVVWADGKRHGRWVTRHSNEYESRGRYINHKKTGVWYKWLGNDRECWSSTYDHGVILENRVVNQEMCRR